MANCKMCIHQNKCFRNGKTRYYGETIASDNVEELCEWFVNTADVVPKSEVIDEFAEKLKEAPIKCGLPLFGLSTKEEIEEYFNDIMLQVRDAIDNIAKEMKGGE